MFYDWKKGGMGKGGSVIKIKDQWLTDQDDLLIHKDSSLDDLIPNKS